MSDEIFFDGVKYVSANSASESSELSQDYIGRLCRDGKVRGRRIGKSWYIDERSFRDFLVRQEYSKSLRRKNLKDDRRREYETSKDVQGSSEISFMGVDSFSDMRGTLARRAAMRRADILHTQMVQKLAKQGEKAAELSSRMVAVPGLADAALRLTTAGHGGLHVPVYALSPLAEFLHKFAALTLSFLLTFGTYALVDPATVQRVTDSATAAGKRIANASARIFERPGTYVRAAGDQIAAAASDPVSAIANVSGALRFFARTLSDGIDEMVYRLAYSSEWFPSLDFVTDDSPSSVAIDVTPLRSARTAISATPQTIATTHTTVTQPVIERVIETSRLITTGGISEEILNQRLDELQGRLMTHIYGTRSGGISSPPASGGIQNQISLITDIDRLNASAISNSTFTDGTITNSTISGSSISSAASISTTEFGAANATTTTFFATTTSLVNATTTTLFSTTASSTSFFAQGATSTTLFSTLARFTTGIINTLTATLATITNLTATELIATNSTTTNATSTNLAVFNQVNAPSYNATSTTATSTFSGGLLATRAPTLAHTFSSWSIGAANTNWANASLVVNPASATGDSNLISAAVDGSAKFLVDAEGDVFVNNLTSVGSVTLSTTSAASFTVEGNTTLGDSISDTVTVNGTLTVSGTTTVASVGGKFGVGTTTPWAKLSVSANHGDANTQLFLVSSSTVSATSTLFALLNTGQAGFGTASPGASALVQLDSTSRGFLPPRMTTAQKSGIGSPASGLVLYDSDLNKLNVYNGTAWKNVGSTEIGGEVTSGTQGSVLFIGDGTVLGQDATNFTFSTSTNRLLTTQASSTRLSVFGTAYFGGTATSSFSSTGALTLGGVGTHMLLATDASGVVVSSSTPTVAAIVATSTSRSSVFPYASSTALTVSGTGYFGTASTSALTLSSFAANRIPYVTTDGAVTSGSALTYDGTTLTAGNLTSSGNVTLGNATTTAFFATTASSTNLFSNAITVGTFAGGNGTFSGTLGVTGLTTLGSASISAATTTALAIGNLTSGRIPFTTTGGSLFDSSALTYANSTNLLTLTNASSTRLSVLTSAAFGSTATSTFNSTGALTLASALGVGSGGTGATSFTGGSVLYGNGTGAVGAVATGTLSATDSSLTFSNSTRALLGGAATVGLNLGNANTWTALQQFANSSSTRLSVYNNAYFGATATSSFDSTGALTLTNALTYGGVILSNAVTGTGNMVLSASPTFTGTLIAADLSATNATSTTLSATTASTTRLFSNMALVGSLGGGTITATSTLSVSGLSTFAGLISTASSTIGNGTAAGGLTISGTATTTNLRVTALTSGRVPYATTGSQLTDSGNLTFDGSLLTVTGNLTATNATTTAFFATTASSTNLFSNAITVGTFTGGVGTFSGTLGVTGLTTLGSASISAATTTALAVGNLTSGRIPFTTTGGSLFDSSALTYANSTNLLTLTNASSTRLSVLTSAAFGSTATSTFSSGGILTLVSTAPHTIPYASSTALSVSGSLYNGALTSGRVTYAGAGGVLQDSTNLTFDGTTLTANSLSLTSALTVANGGTGATTLTGLLQGNGTSAITAVTGTAGQFPYFNGTNTLLATSSIYLATSGNVGIGTTTPNNVLSLYSATKSALEFSGGAGRGAFTMGFDVSNNRFSIASSTALGTTDRFTISPQGEFGINTTPGSTVVLNLSAPGSSSNTVVQLTGSGIDTLQLVAAASGSSILKNTNNSALLFGTNNTEVARFSASGNFGIASTSPSARLSVQGSDTSASTKGVVITDSLATELLTVFNDGLTQLKNLLVTASSTIGGGTQAGGLTVSGGATTTGFLVVQGTAATSTFAAGVSATRLNVTSTSATSTFANGLAVNGGCLFINGSCVGQNGSVTLTAVRTYTSNDTWTKPTNVAYIVVEAWGGGGSGAAGNTTDSTRGAGGGGGGYVQKTVMSNIDSTLTITIGSGGAGVTATAGGANGNAGNSTTVVGTNLGTLTAGGGGGGTYANIGGVSGSASGGDLNLAGETGEHRPTSGGGEASRGGSSPRGGQGGGPNVSTDGNAPGGGGSNGNHTGGAVSGAGGAGRVIVYEYTTQTLTSSGSGVTLTRVVTASAAASNVTYTPPSNISYIEIEVWGAGAGGGGASTNANGYAGGGGGGAGGYSRKLVTSPSGTYYYTVGSGGAGGAGGDPSGSTGTSGNQSCFGTNATACTSPSAQANGGTGGGGGLYSGGVTVAGTGGAGGAAGTGDITVTGGVGDHANTPTYGLGVIYNTGSTGGTGGNAPAGGGGGTEQGAGSAFGGGGGGGHGSSGAAGGAGGAGGIIIREYTTGAATAGSVGSGTQGQFAFYNAAGTNLTATSSIYLATSGNIGIGTTTPWGLLAIEQGTETNSFVVSNTSSSTPSLVVLGVNGDGKVGIGTASPLGKTHIVTVNDTAPTNVPAWDSRHFLVGAAGNAGAIALSYNQTDNYGVIGAISPGTAARSLSLNPAGGNVGIGTTTPMTLLTIKGSNAAFTITNNNGNRWGILNDDAANGINFQYNGSTKFYFNTSGVPFFTGISARSGAASVLCSASGTGEMVYDGAGACGTSSGRFKHSIESLLSGEGLSILEQVRPVSFEYNHATGTTEYGFIAEEIEQIDPMLIAYGPDGLPLTVKYQNFIPFLTQAVQELNVRTQGLDASTAPTSTPSLYIDADGNLGVGTTTPQYKLHVVGDVAAQSFVNISTRESKTDISEIDDENEERILSALASTTVFSYRYKNEATSTPMHLGLITDEAPPEVLSLGGGGVDIYKLAAFTFAGVKAQQRQLNDLASTTAALGLRVDTIEQELANLNAGTGSSSGGITLAAVLDALKALGAEIMDGLTRFAYLIADQFVVGSPEQPTGITLYDKATGEPYCFSVENGAATTTPGLCAAIPQVAGAAAGSTPSSDSGQASSPQAVEGGAASSSVPVIEIQGNNPATISVGSTYADLGALITGPTQADTNLGIHTFVNGVAMDSISIDTSIAGTHTIEYVATNDSGTATSTRTVIVESVGSGDGAGAGESGNATSTPSGGDSSNATSTPDGGSDSGGDSGTATSTPDGA